MNFLAHLFLAENPEGKIGNFIADAIKGSNFTHLPLGVQRGIVHHRAIDTFTDSHDIVKQSKRRLHDRYGHFKGVIIDILYDHFLAKNWHHYSPTKLDIFAENTYNLLQENLTILPDRTQYLLPYMREQNWLYNYHSIEGISQILWGMNKRTKGISQMDLAKEDLVLHYTVFQDDFNAFFEELRNFSVSYIQQKQADLVLTKLK